MPVRLKREIIDFISLFLMPVFALMLPWSLAYRFYYRLAGRPWLFQPRVKQAHANASKLLEIADDHEWCRRHRLLLMLDVIDFWISFLQPWRVQRLVRQHGKWPEERPLVIVGTHWGPAFMLLRALYNHDIHPIYVLRKNPSWVFKGERVRQLYVSCRRLHMRSMFPGKRYQPGGFPRPLLRALQKQESILVLADVPAAKKRDVHAISLYHHNAQIDSGMFELFISKKARFATYRLAFDFCSGQRNLFIKAIAQLKSTASYRSTLDEFVASTLHADSTQWNLWQVADSFFVQHNNNTN